MKKLKNAFSILSIIGLSFPMFSQSQNSTQAHQDSVQVIVPSGKEYDRNKTFFSAGKDGFLINWSPDDIGEHYQVTDLEIKLAAVSPNGSEIAVYETDGGGINRLSVWNWNTLQKRFSKRFTDTITSLNYSANGTYIMCGTASVDGAVFIRTQNGSVVNKITDNTGIVSYISTSASEKTAVTYSPAGKLSYYSLVNGKLKQKFSITQGLEQPKMFAENMFLAGVRDDKIYIYQATTGKNVATVNAENPLLLVSSLDKNLYYLTNNSRGNYSLNMLENVDNRNVSTPRILKTFSGGPRGSGEIVTGAKSGNEILLGSKNGLLYKTDSFPTTGTQKFSAITENMFEKIYDMSPIGEDFYFLTKKQIYRSSYDTGYVTPIGKNQAGHNQLITYGEKIILWSKESRDPVVLFTDDKTAVETLFTPKSNLQSVRLFGNLLVEIENNSVINTFDMEKKVLKEVYTGSALQDAVIARDGKLYVAKSFATNPKASLLCVDMDTGETVPSNLGGNVSFALEIYGNDIYGIGVQSDESSKSTIVFRYNPSSRSTQGILRVKDEDSNAFSYIHYPFLYTNIGKEAVRVQSMNGGKSFNLKRTASLPLKVCENSSKVVVLNRDGCISWYEPNSSQVLADWYLTSDGQWFEY